MSINPYQPHIFVIPEDDANGDLARGFMLGVDNRHQIRVDRVARGWGKVLTKFKDSHVGDMIRLSNRLLVLLIDFDSDEGRLAHAKSAIPNDLIDRVFVLGVWSEPQRLKIGSYENIGKALAEDCRNGTNKTWNHELLRHNSLELNRLRDRARAILFD